MPPEPLGLSANQWQFLSDPDRYVAACKAASTARELVGASTSRQFQTARDILARLNGSQGEHAQRGILLADDVGLGKTMVAALVAWVVASAGEKRGVRILAPNDVMKRRWEEELISHVEPLKKCAKHLDVREDRVKRGKPLLFTVLDPDRPRAGDDEATEFVHRGMRWRSATKRQRPDRRIHEDLHRRRRCFL